MGNYIDPGNENFEFIVNDEYVDKSGLISVINSTINTKRMLSCVSRPRRFGKTYAANMLAAYYDCSCDSQGLFDGLEIAKEDGYESHLNHYHVLYLDITGFLADTTVEGLTAFIKKEILEDAGRVFPRMQAEDTVKKCLKRIVDETGKK